MLNPTNLLADRVLLSLYTALEAAGVWDFLVEHPQSSVQDIATATQTDEMLLKPALDFLVLHDPAALVCRNSRYSVDNRIADDRIRNILHFSLAYEPVFARLTDLLQKRAVYGKDVLRNGSHLRVSSRLYNEGTWEKLKEWLLEQSAITTVVDLGCSGGDFLKDVQQNAPHIHGIGVDIDARVIAEAQTEAATNTFRLHVGDAADPDTLAALIEAKDGSYAHVAFVGITMWHEFLADGIDRVASIFKKYKDLFPGAFFLVAEYEGFSKHDLEFLQGAEKDAASVYQLAQVLTGQGIPPARAVWCEIFSKSGVRLSDIIDAPPNSVIVIGTL